MKSILNEIFMRLLENEVVTPPSTETERISDAYEEVCNALNAEQKKLFDTFEERWSAHHSENEREMFFRGFKAGVILAFEIFNDL